MRCRTARDPLTGTARGGGGGPQGWPRGCPTMGRGTRRHRGGGGGCTAPATPSGVPSPCTTSLDPSAAAIPGWGYNPRVRIPGWGYNPRVRIPGWGYNPRVRIPGWGYNPRVRIPGWGYNPRVRIPGWGYPPISSSVLRCPPPPPPPPSTPLPFLNRNSVRKYMSRQQTTETGQTPPPPIPASSTVPARRVQACNG